MCHILGRTTYVISRWCISSRSISMTWYDPFQFSANFPQGLVGLLISTLRSIRSCSPIPQGWTPRSYSLVITFLYLNTFCRVSALTSRIKSSPSRSPSKVSSSKLSTQNVGKAILSGRIALVLKAKLNDDSLDPVLGVVWEAHKMLDSSST